MSKNKKKEDRWVNWSGRQVIMHCPVCSAPIYENVMNAPCPNCQGEGFKTLRNRKQGRMRKEDEQVENIHVFDIDPALGGYL